jgi:hypothetical protein
MGIRVTVPVETISLYVTGSGMFLTAALLRAKGGKSGVTGSGDINLNVEAIMGIYYRIWRLLN